MIYLNTFEPILKKIGLYMLTFCLREIEPANKDVRNTLEQGRNAISVLEKGEETSRKIALEFADVDEERACLTKP